VADGKTLSGVNGTLEFVEQGFAKAQRASSL
jgi:hypothetical protein